MYNDKTYDLVMALLTHEPASKDRTEIIKFYLLPRNTPVRPMIELPDEEQKKQLGTVKRKSAQDHYDEEHPLEKQEKDAITKTLKGVVDG